MATWRRWHRNYRPGSPDRLEYVEGREYTTDELERIAETMLYDDSMSARPINVHPAILNENKEARLRKHEIYANEGSVDPSVVSGIYWRTHPQGLKHRGEAERSRKGGRNSFYDD